MMSDLKKSGDDFISKRSKSRRSQKSSVAGSRVPMPPRRAFKDFDESAFGGGQDSFSSRAQDQFDIAKKQGL